MVGIVKLINMDTNVIALKTTLNQYSIIEATDLNMIELGDVFLGEIESLGAGSLFNITKSCVLDVVIHRICFDHSIAVKVLNFNTP